MTLDYNLRQSQPSLPGQDAETVTLPEDGPAIDPSSKVVTIDLTDGGVEISFGGVNAARSEDADKHDENLANHVDRGTLDVIASDLLRLIGDDEYRQERRLNDLVEGLQLLGIKLDQPRSEPGDEGMSVVRHPLMLEAILRFQANARGEMLPSDGPVKVRNDGNGVKVTDEMANALETDMNHYLTVGAPEFYPSTDRMFFSVAFSGEAYKKVYWHPIKRRPVSEAIDRKDIILSDGAVSLESCGRVTHRSRMRLSEVRRMQLAGAWRETNISTGLGILDDNPVDEKLANISGVDPKTTLEPEHNDREIYECYCELDLKGFEHKEKGEETGLPLPYRVTLDKEALAVLEIRRWWEEGDEDFIRKEVFVEYIFVPAFPGVNLGFLHILGNATRALTAAWRIALDNGMLANFPGGVMARSTGRQQTTNIRVQPGGVVPIDTDGGPIKDVFMPLPYRDVTPGFIGIVSNIEETSQRVGGTAEVSTGEGRSDAPVGTTIALIEQATMVLNAVHKRMHNAQAKEFQLLRDLFKKDPESLWRGNKTPALPRDHSKVVAALNDADIVPVADPNCSSQSLRIQKAIAVKTLASSNPQLYDLKEVDLRILDMIGIEDAESLFSQNPQGPGPDPLKVAQAQAQTTTAQAKAAEIQAKIQSGAFAPKSANPEELALKALAEKTKAQDSIADNANRAQDRDAKMAMERMKLAREALIHGETLRHERGMHDDKMNLDRARLEHEVNADQAATLNTEQPS